MEPWYLRQKLDRSLLPSCLVSVILLVSESLFFHIKRNGHIVRLVVFDDLIEHIDESEDPLSMEPCGRYHRPHSEIRSEQKAVAVD